MFSTNEKNGVCKNSIMNKLKYFMIAIAFAVLVSAVTNTEYTYAADNVLVKTGDEKEAKVFHQKLMKCKTITLKITGKPKTALKKLEKLENNLFKVNKYGLSCCATEKDVKVKKKAIVIKLNKEYAKQYKEANFILKKMKKFYLKKNVGSLKKKLKFDDSGYNRYEFKKSEDNSATPEPGTYEDGDKFEIYTLNYGDDNSILSITYFPEKGYYDLADYSKNSDDFEKGKYLDALKDIKQYFYTTGSNAKHYKVTPDYVEKIKTELKAANDKVDAEIKAEKDSIEKLKPEAVKYLKDKSLKTEYIACATIKNNDFCDISDALKIYMISKCFVYDDGSKKNHNPFIQYNEVYSGSSGGIVYHYDNKPNVFHMRDYYYDGNDKFFKMQKNGKVSNVLKQIRTGKFKGVCHDYATAEGYLYTLLNIEHYYGYSKKANHAISIVKAKNSKGKTFWVYQNYDMLGGADKVVSIDGICLKGKQYAALDASKKVQKQIKKSKFKMSDFN